MKPFVSLALLPLILVSSVACSLVTPFSPAKIAQEPAVKTANGGVIHRYRIGGLQQMVIFIDPKRDSLWNTNPRDSFTQHELSKLNVSVTSISGALSVNGLKIRRNQTAQIDLKKVFNFHGREGEVKDWGDHISNIRFVSYNNVPAHQNLCDFILTIEDPEGITRTTGLKVHGGFTDSL